MHFATELSNNLPISGMKKHMKTVKTKFEYNLKKKTSSIKRKP